jgi:hypothetical protein
MRFIKIILVLLYLSIYVYSVRMTQLHPEETKWGWMCTLIFLIFTIWSLGEFTKYGKRNEDENK